MSGIKVVAAVDSGRMRAMGLMNHGLYAMRWNDRPRRMLAEERGRRDFFRDHDHALSCLGLLLVFPTGTMDRAVAQLVGGLHMNQRNVGVERSQGHIFLARERTLDPPDVACAGATL